MTSCLTRRARLAPSDARSASSPRRPIPRAINRPARFTHAMTSTVATTAIRSRSAGRPSLTRCSCSPDTKTPMSLSMAMLTSERRGDDGHLGPERLEADARLQPAVTLERARPDGAGVGGIDGQRGVGVGVHHADAKSPRRDADDRVRPSRHRQPSSEHAGVAAKPPLPEAVAEDDDLFPARPRLRLREHTAQRGRHAEDTKELRGRLDPRDLFGAVAADDVERRRLHQRERLERARAGAAIRRSSRGWTLTVPSAPSACSRRTTSRSEPGYGSGRRRTALTKVKIVVFAPMPRASDRIATAVKPGLFRRARSANRTSLRTLSRSARPRASRHSSFRGSIAPISRRAA